MLASVGGGGIRLGGGGRWCVRAGGTQHRRAVSRPGRGPGKRQAGVGGGDVRSQLKIKRGSVGRGESRRKRQKGDAVEPVEIHKDDRGQKEGEE